VIRIIKPPVKILVLAILISFTISGCFTLSDDITPPPDNIQPTIVPATQVPRPTSTQSESQPTTENETVDNGDGTVSVDIVDQTGGVLLEEGLEVRLEGYEQFELIYQSQETARDSNQILFNEVPLEPGLIYFASIDYGGAIYRSELVEINEETSSLSLFIQVFDTTTDRSALIIDRVHVLLEVLQPDFINVVEIYIISNLGDRTVVADAPGEPSVTFPLPEGAGTVEFDDGVIGGRYLLTPDGFGDTVSVPPGSGVYQVLVYYTLPYQGNRIDFKQEMAFPVGAVVVMIPDGNLKIKNTSLTDMGVQDIPGGAVQVYSGSTIDEGQSLEFRISGKPAGSNEGLLPDGNGNQTLIIGLGVSGVLLLLIGVIIFFNKRQQLDEEIPEDDDQDQGLILDSIIALDDLYKAGEISKEVYQTKRQELKDQLSDLAE
jgi:hypothetical protein